VVQGKRYSLPNSRIMIHQPLGGAQGQAAGKVTTSHVTACLLLHTLKQERQIMAVCKAQ
jgi:ATP-dependent protease ClpP protease subunit